MAICLLGRSGAFHYVRSPPISAPIPMRKQLTGEPVAGKLHTGFGGRGRRQPFPTPIPWPAADRCLKIADQLALLDPLQEVDRFRRTAAPQRLAVTVFEATNVPSSKRRRLGRRQAHRPGSTYSWRWTAGR